MGLNSFFTLPSTTRSIFLRGIEIILKQSLIRVHWASSSLFCTAKTCLKEALGDFVKGWRWAIRPKGIFGGKLLPTATTSCNIQN
jgi:hypothetical protein